jgi:hypothetical protein
MTALAVAIRVVIVVATLGGEENDQLTGGNRSAAERMNDMRSE